MGSEEAFATSLPPDSGCRMRLLCTHGTCERFESQIPTPLGSTRQPRREQLLLRQLSLAMRSSWGGSSPAWDPDSTCMILHKCPSCMLMAQHSAESLFATASFPKMHPKDPLVSWRLSGVPLQCASCLHAEGHIGVNPSQYTSTPGATNRPGDKTKGSFLQAEDATETVCKSGNFKGKVATRGNFRAVEPGLG